MDSHNLRHKRLLAAAINGEVDILQNLISKGGIDVNYQDTDGWNALIYASMNGHTEIDTCLINAKAHVDLQDTEGRNALIYASWHGRTKIVTCLINAKASVDLQDIGGCNALMFASWNGRTGVVKSLINAKANVDLQDIGGCNALIYASRNGHTVIVKCLINAKANVAMQSKDGWNALMWASKNGHTEIVTCLINSKANVDMRDKKGWNALMHATKNEHTEIVTYLINANADVHMQDEEYSPGVKCFTDLLEECSWYNKVQNGWNALMYASEDGHSEIVTSLINAKANVDMQDNNGRFALILASKHGHTEIVTSLINAKANVDMQSNVGYTALMSASWYGRTEIVTSLINAKANVDMQRNNGRNALMSASEHGHSEIVTSLINAKSNLDIQDKDGCSALVYAYTNERPEIVSSLINAKANVDIQDMNGRNSLMRASEHGHTEIVTSLINAKANVDMQDKNGCSALVYAYTNERTEIVSSLINAKVNVDIQDKNGRNALMWASEHGHTEIVTSLINAKANVDMQDKDGCSALVYAYTNGHTDIVTSLINAKANVDVQDKNGQNTLMWASEHGHTDIVTSLNNEKANVDMQSNDGWNALMYASKRGHTEIVTSLINEKANVDMQDNDGWNALMYASKRGHTEIVTSLINEKANVDMQSSNGWSALMYASEDGHTEIVKCLINANANVDKQDNNGWSALMYASEDGHTEIVTCLINVKAKVDMQDNVGRNALMWASRNGHTQIVTCLINANANVDMQDNDKQTALHVVTTTSFNRRIIIMLLESGANIDVTDKDDKKPLDYIDLQKEDNKSIRQVLERRKYSDLLATGSRPLNVVKLFLLGHPAAGKTTLKTSLVGGSDILASIKRRNKAAEPTPTYIPTPGIDIRTFKIKQVGTLCIWDCAGQVEFHVTHGMFLGSENAMAAVVYDIRNGDADIEDKLYYWLKFLKCGLSSTQKSKFKIIIVGTHFDQIHDQKTGIRLWKQIVGRTIKDFGDVLAIEDICITINGCLATSEAMTVLRSRIKIAADQIREGKTIPQICDEILNWRNQWLADSDSQGVKQRSTKIMQRLKTMLPEMKRMQPSKSSFDEQVSVLPPSATSQTTSSVNATCPVISFSQLEEFVRQIDSYAKTDVIRLACNFLQDMGELFIAQFGGEEHKIVLNTQWICYKIIGPTFAGAEFKNQLTRLPDRPFFSRQELECHYSDVADFPTLELLLRSLDLMVKFDKDMYIIFAKLQDETATIQLTEGMKFSRGICIYLTENKSMFLPGFFPAIQARIMKRFASEEKGHPQITLGALKFVGHSEGMAQLTKDREVIKVAVTASQDNLHECYQDLELLSNLIEAALLELSPGTSVTKGYLSPRALEEASTLDDVAYYAQKEIERAETKDGVVYHKKKQMKEKVEDILLAGHDPTFIRKHGTRCDFKWLLQKEKQELLREMDDTTAHPLRQDYRSLADALDIPEGKVKELETRGNESVTERLLGYWKSITGKRMTFGLMLTLLKHPGLVASDEASKCMEDTLERFGHKGPYPLESTNFVAIPDNLLVARAVVRRNHKSIRDVLRKNILESPLCLQPLKCLRSFVSDEDEEKIENLIRNNERIQAADYLLSILVGSRQPGWFEGIWMLLCQHGEYPLAELLVKAQDNILSEDVFKLLDKSSVLAIKDSGSQASQHIDAMKIIAANVTKPAVASTSNYVKVCEAIQAMCYMSLSTIQDCVEKWHQNQQPKMQACVTPNKCPSHKKPAKYASCQPCIDWGIAVEAEHYPRPTPGKGIQGIQWKNVNSTLLHKDPVEVAKGFVFIIPHGQTFMDFSDFDVGGILKLMMGFVDYHGGDQVCYDKIQKVVNIRNGLSHMKIKDKMYISDNQLETLLNDIEECVDVIKGRQQTLRADDIKDRLKQIRQTAVTTDIVTRALGNLTDGLKQALDEAQTTQTEQLELFMKSQTQEIKQTVQDSVAKWAQEVQESVAKGAQEVQDSVAKGAREVVDKLQPQLDMIHKEIGKLSQPPQYHC